MAPIKPQHVFRFTTSDALEAAMLAYCKRKGITPSQLARTAIAEKIGKPNLAETVKSGRPIQPGK